MLFTSIVSLQQFLHQAKPTCFRRFQGKVFKSDKNLECYVSIKNNLPLPNSSVKLFLKTHSPSVFIYYRKWFLKCSIEKQISCSQTNKVKHYKVFSCIILNTAEVNEGPVPREKKSLPYLRKNRITYGSLYFIHFFLIALKHSGIIMILPNMRERIIVSCSTK